MAARKSRFDPDYIRAKIQTTQLVKRLQDYAFGRVAMNKTQVTAALGLIRKTLPDLAVTTLQGPDGAPLLAGITVNFVKPDGSG